MQTKHLVSRGLERLMSRRAAIYLGANYGLAGLGACDNFAALEDAMASAGIPQAGKSVADLKRMHRCGCERVMRALPIAVSAMRLQEAGGEDALAGIFSKIGKKLAKLSPSHQLLKKVAPKALAFSPSQIALTMASRKKAAKSAEAKAASAAKKQAKKDAKAAKKAAKAAAALAAANAQNLSPVEAGAAVLANQAGLNLTTPEAQQFAQDAVSSGGGGGGAAMPDSAMFNAPPEGTADNTIFGLPPMVAAGIGAAGVGILFLAFSGKRGR